MATHFSVLAWEIPWTEKLGGLQFVGSQKNKTHLVTKQQQQLNLIVKLFLFFVSVMTGNSSTRYQENCKQIQKGRDTGQVVISAGFVNLLNRIFVSSE